MKIEKSTYQGYLWYSNEQKPKILNNEPFELEIADNANPFIIEGQLFDGTKSISIKYIDGKHIAKEYEVKSSDFEDSNVEILKFIPNRMESVEKLRFLQYWRPQKDKICDGMEVLQPAELVFIGFKNKEK